MTGSHGLFPKSRKRAFCDELQVNLVPGMEHLVNNSRDAVVEASEKINAVGFIQDWRTRYPDTYPMEKEINAFSELCKLPRPFVSRLLNEMLPSRKTEVTLPLQEQSSTNRLIKKPRLRLPGQETAPVSDRVFLEQATKWIKEKAPKCKPVSNPALLRRHDSKIYQCILQCGSSFLRKGEWRRHEELNYPQEGWVCSLDATVVVMGILICVYCGVQNPDVDHAHQEHHDHAVSKHCKHKPFNAPGRFFKRKERFRKHLKRDHPGVPSEEYASRNYLSIKSNFPSQCGFCLEYMFKDWPDRIQHLGKHFEDGQDMLSWKSPSLGNLNGDKDYTGDGNSPDNDFPNSGDSEREDTSKGGSSGSGNRVKFYGAKSGPWQADVLSLALKSDENDLNIAHEEAEQSSTSDNQVASQLENSTDAGRVKWRTRKSYNSKTSIQEIGQRCASPVRPQHDPSESSLYNGSQSKSPAIQNLVANKTIPHHTTEGIYFEPETTYVMP